MNQYTNIDLATAIRMHKEALNYYSQVCKDFQQGKHTRVLGVGSTNLLTAYSEVLYNIVQLNKFHPGSGHHDIIAYTHFRMTMNSVSRREFNDEDVFYYWDRHSDVQKNSAVKVETIDYDLSDNRKSYFVLLSNGRKKFDSTPRVYRKFKNNEKEEYLQTQYKAIPTDWAFQFKIALKESNESGLYLPIYEKKIEQEYTSISELHSQKNVVSLF